MKLHAKQLLCMVCVVRTHCLSPLMLSCLAGGLDDADMLRHSSARSDSEASMGSPLTHHGNPRDASGTPPAPLSHT